MPEQTVAYWLVVVDRDRDDLYTKLRGKFAGSSFVDILRDRRWADRRRARRATPSDQRRRDRRSRGTSGESATGAAYRVIEKGDGFQVLQLEARVPAECPDCGMSLEFELPRLSELPARVEIRVIHTTTHTKSALTSRSVQHCVEAQAFRPSGRPFLACRMVARRRTGTGAPLLSPS